MPAARAASSRSVPPGPTRQRALRDTERAATEASISKPARQVSVVDVIDRVLDKGIVIDAWVRSSLLGLEPVTLDVRVVVASIEVYQRYAAAAAKPSQRNPECG